MSAGRSPFVLRVPIDVSQAPDFTPGRRISALAWNRRGDQQHQLVTFTKKGTATATFELEQVPESLQVVLGPETATPSDLRHLQTPCITVPATALQASAEVELPAIRVSAWDWWWWQHWRQSFHVRGRVVDAHGRGVAGAAVSAFDVDAWWWWTTQEQVGSAITGSDGSFFIEFTRCCEWRPSWWWSSRNWQVDATLKERITSFVRQYPELGSLAAAAKAVPSLEIFAPLLTSGTHPLPHAMTGALSLAGRTISPAALDAIRERLVEILPREFPVPVWPWSEWTPWEDCGANLIFRVTGAQSDPTAFLVNEGVAGARWDIPSCLSVKLIAREVACSRSVTDWTLVDHLFPQRLSIPAGHKQREPSANIFLLAS
jgi:hypothetical protein